MVQVYIEPILKGKAWEGYSLVIFGVFFLVRWSMPQLEFLPTAHSGSERLLPSLACEMFTGLHWGWAQGVVW